MGGNDMMGCRVSGERVCAIMARAERRPPTLDTMSAGGVLALGLS